MSALANWLMVVCLVASTVGCGGAAATGEPAGAGSSGASQAVEPGCVAERFAAPPRDLGLDPPPETVTPGDGPLPDCPGEP